MAFLVEVESSRQQLEYIKLIYLRPRGIKKLKLHILVGPALSGKTDRLAEEMELAHHENPFS